MYHFGMFVTDRQMRPLPLVLLEATAPKLKARYNDLGCACAVFVLTERDYPAQYCMEFGFPVNLVVSTDHHPGWGFLTENVYDILDDISCEVFAVPYVKPSFFDDLDVMRFDTKPTWLPFMTEADHVHDTTTSIAAHRELVRDLCTRLEAEVKRLSDDPTEQRVLFEEMKHVAVAEVHRLLSEN